MSADNRWAVSSAALVVAALIGLALADAKYGCVPRQHSTEELRRIVREEMARDGGR